MNRYFQAYDTSRNSLLDVYSDNSFFSLNSPIGMIEIRISNIEGGPVEKGKYGTQTFSYRSFSRNLLHVNDLGISSSDFRTDIGVRTKNFSLKVWTSGYSSRI